MPGRRRKGTAPPTGTECSRRTDKVKCHNPGAVYACSAWHCRAHEPKLDPTCTHSLGDERCAYCGGPMP
jgi:hypothetical protein